jgi:hypothetical protein
MKPFRIFLTLIIFGGIAFAFSYFLITGNSTRQHDPLLHGHPHLILTQDIYEKVLITWRAAGQTESSLIFYDTVSRRGDPSRYTFRAEASRSDEITALLGERQPSHTENFTVELEGLNSMTTYYFVLKNNGEVSLEYHFITPPRRGD